MIESNMTDLISNENNPSSVAANGSYSSYLNSANETSNGLSNSAFGSRWNDHYAAAYYGSADSYYRNLQYSSQQSKFTFILKYININYFLNLLNLLRWNLSLSILLDTCQYSF